ncbi:dTDP-glucose 4,6-dehydratase [hydrothermal vent metagenome]|uniref:dTDP-glucose 4,6-dehydratase n=1 Tax=hydrothermal vent metagenome TaxID=652676 RepID=A0A3B0YIR9_9ZZZZ
MSGLLITGGAGFIGGNFVRHWMQKHPQDRVVILDALTYAGNLESLEDLEADPGFHFVQADICDRPTVQALFEEQQINRVAHFAAESHVDRSILGPAEFIRTNIEGTFTLLDVARAAWGGDRDCRFLHVSTDEVYGSLETNDPAFTEAHPYRPNSPYSASKASSDHLVRAWFETYDFPVLTTNCSNNYGPYQFPEKLIPLVILNALEGKPLPVYGDGSNVRDWLHVEDHCRGIAEVLERGTPGEVYNIGGNNERSNIEIVQLLCDQLDRRQPGARPYSELIQYVTDRPGHDFRYAIDSSKIQQELGWQPKVAFDTGLEQTIDWYLQHLDWCERIRSGEYRRYYLQQYGSRVDETPG